MRWFQRSLFVWVAVVLLVPLTHAHHSGAVYDQTKTLSMSGTLKEFDWNAPHAGVRLAYTNEKGEAAEMLVSTLAPSMITRQGFKPNDFRAGQKIEVTYHPYRTGSPGGDLVTLKLEDGRVLQSMPPPPPKT